VLKRTHVLQKLLAERDDGDARGDGSDETAGKFEAEAVGRGCREDALNETNGKDETEVGVEDEA